MYSFSEIYTARFEEIWLISSLYDYSFMRIKK